MNERVDVLSLYDVVGTPGVGADVGHIDSIAKVRLDRVVPCVGAEKPELTAGTCCKIKQGFTSLLTKCAAGGGVRRRPAGQGEERG